MGFEFKGAGVFVYGSHLVFGHTKINLKPEGPVEAFRTIYIHLTLFD